MKVINIFLDYLFINFYKLFLKTKGRDTAETSATIFISLSFLALSYSMVLVVFSFLDDFINVSKGVWLIISLLWALSLYYYFYHKYEKDNKYFEVIKKIEDSNLSWDSLFVIVFHFFCLACLFFSFVYYLKTRGSG